MRDVGLELESVLHALRRPLGNLLNLSRFASRKIGGLLAAPIVPVRSAELEADAARLARLVAALGSSVERELRVHQQQIVDRQYQLGRISNAATELYVSACTEPAGSAVTIRRSPGPGVRVRTRIRTLLFEDRQPSHTPLPATTQGPRRCGYDSPSRPHVGTSSRWPQPTDVVIDVLIHVLRCIRWVRYRRS